MSCVHQRLFLAMSPGWAATQAGTARLVSRRSLVLNGPLDRRFIRALTVMRSQGARDCWAPRCSRHPAACLSFCLMTAEICCRGDFLSSILMVHSLPIWRLTDRIVTFPLVTACRLTTAPKRTFPVLANATANDVIRGPSAFVIIVGSPSSTTAVT